MTSKTASKEGASAVSRPAVQPKKRPRSERDLDERQAYYDRLLHKCRVDLNRQAKATKTFETQKLIRKIKEKGNGSGDATQDVKLQQLKGFALDAVIQEAIRRLGLLQLDPKLLQPRSEESEASGDDTTLDTPIGPTGPTNEPTGDASNHETSTTRMALSSDTTDETIDEPNGDIKTMDESTAWIAQRILQHKNMCTALERWNDQITEYRRWCLRLQERLDGGPREKTKKPKGKQPNTALSKSNPLTATSSMFVTLGDADQDNENATQDTDPLGYYGPAGGATGVEVKKNRQGQRARRAKVAAVEAKKQGRRLQPEESLNWRQPKVRTNDDEPGSGRSGGPPRRAAQATPDATGEPLPPPESLHPSWQARKEQKEGIVAFQGKKITFD